MFVYYIDFFSIFLLTNISKLRYYGCTMKHLLAIESSCDDTSVAIVRLEKERTVLVCQKTASQIDIHKQYGGVIPEIAGRKHAEKILPVISAVLEEANLKKADYVAVTTGPGLMTGLLVGMEAAKNLAYLWQVPLVSVNHIDGHLHSIEVASKDDQSQQIQFPAVALTVSGGHTQLVLLKDHGDYELIGQTRDDAAGECFDKVAKILGFDYPGGPPIAARAEHGDPKAIPFPRPMINSGNFDMSFAGLKTAVLYHLKDNPPQSEQEVNDVCASFQQAIVDVLTSKAIKAVQEHHAASFLLVGGVSANKTFRRVIDEHITVPVLLSPKGFAMDNAAMIAYAAAYKVQKEKLHTWQNIQANPHWAITDV